MGLLDGVIGSMLQNMGNTAAQGGNSAVMSIVMGLIQQNGGLGGLVDQLSRNGLGQQVASWVGTGENLPVTAEQLSQAVGNGPLADLASRFGIDPQALGGNLAQFLPEIVNQMTPNGQLPANANDSASLEQGLASLAGKLFS